MSTLIKVSASASQQVPPELASARLLLATTNSERGAVTKAIQDVHNLIISELRKLELEGTVASWAASQLRVWGFRPTRPDGTLAPLTHQATSEIEAVFNDFTALSFWLDFAMTLELVTIDGIDWLLTEETRRRVTADVQRSAITEVMDKGTAYANALGLGQPTVTELADTDIRSSITQPAARLFAMDASGAPPTDMVPKAISVMVTVEAQLTAGPVQ